MRTALNISLALWVVLLTGCGSINRRWEGNHGPYVGVKYDSESLKSASNEWDFFPALDIPLSAIMDTFFLPYDLAKGDNNQLPPAHVEEAVGAPSPIEGQSNPGQTDAVGTVPR